MEIYLVKLVFIFYLVQVCAKKKPINPKIGFVMGKCEPSFHDLSLCLVFWQFISPSADGTVDSGQGSSVFTESRVSSQQTVSYGSQHEQAHATGTLPGHAASAVQAQAQPHPHGVYPPSSMVSSRARECKPIMCSVQTLLPN